LVVIEPDQEVQPALDKAKQLAKLAEAALELVLAEYSPYLEDGYYFDPEQARQLRYEHGERRMEELEALARPLREQGLEVTCTAAWGNPPYGQVLQRIEQSKPSLVIKATRHHSRLARYFLANEDWELVRYCPVPLLLCKGRPWGSQPVFVASVDPKHVHDKPAELDSRIIETAKGFAALSAGEVRLFHSSWLPPLSGIYPLVEDESLGQGQLESLAHQHGINETACIWSNEDVVPGLTRAVEELQASAVVMGAISRSRLDRVLIGNTAERVMDSLDCDLLIIKPAAMPPTSQMLF
jgi:universal stress protein E